MDYPWEPNKAVLVKQNLEEIDWSPEIYNR